MMVLYGDTGKTEMIFGHDEVESNLTQASQPYAEDTLREI